MFGKKCPDPFKDKVKCEKCKCWLDKSDAQEVRIEGGMVVFSEFYCPIHRVPYDRVRYDGHFYLPPHFYREVEVLEDGTPIGYEKKKEKKSRSPKT